MCNQVMNSPISWDFDHVSSLNSLVGFLALFGCRLWEQGRVKCQLSFQGVLLGSLWELSLVQSTLS
jgi:hypothetical protein